MARGRWLLFVVLWCGVAWGDTPLQQAKRLYQAASKHYDLQKYAEALDEFQQAYSIKEDPVFLYNIAQCQRLLEQHEPALRSYKMFLTRAPNAPNRADVEARIATLQAKLDAERAAKAKPVEPVVAPVVTAPPAVEVAAAPAPAPRKTPVYKKWWLWTTVGVVAVGVGLGVGLGLGLNQPHKEAIGTPVEFN